MTWAPTDVPSECAAPARCGIHVRRAVALAALLGALGCAPTAPHVYRDEGASLSFPVRPEVRRVREGPWADATVVSARSGGITYELARFVLTRVPDEAQRTALLAEVERGLSARGGVRGVDASDTTFRNRRSRRLVIRFDDGTAARFVVFFRDERTLVELSVFGPEGGLEREAERFFTSYSTSSPPSSPSAGPSSEPSSATTDRSDPEAATQ